MSVRLITMFIFAVGWACPVPERAVTTAVALAEFLVIIAHQAGSGVPVETTATSAVLRVTIAALALAEVAPVWSAITTGDSSVGAGISEGTRVLVGRQSRPARTPWLLPSVPAPLVPRQAGNNEGSGTVSRTHITTIILAVSVFAFICPPLVFQDPLLPVICFSLPSSALSTMRASIDPFAKNNAKENSQQVVD